MDSGIIEIATSAGMLGLMAYMLNYFIKLFEKKDEEAVRRLDAKDEEMMRRLDEKDVEMARRLELKDTEIKDLNKHLSNLQVNTNTVMSEFTIAVESLRIAVLDNHTLIQRDEYSQDVDLDAE